MAAVAVAVVVAVDDDDDSYFVFVVGRCCAFPLRICANLILAGR